MEAREWAALPVERSRIWGMAWFVVVGVTVLVLSILWLLDPSLPWSQKAWIGVIAAFPAVSIPLAVWRFIHSATSLELGDIAMVVGIAFISHRTISRQSVISVRCHEPKYSEPDCRVVHRGGYFDVYLPQDERREDIVRQLTELAPVSRA